MKSGRIILAGIVLVLIAIAFYYYLPGGSDGPDVSGMKDNNYADRVACDSANLPKGENLVYLDITSGCVVIELLPKLAPGHTERIAGLVTDKFYDGIVFHRVIDGFMAQAGDPTGTGSGGSDLPDLEAEFSSEPFARGVLGMARTQDPNSANSQFFIVLAPANHLNGQYTVFGKVVEGMDVVDAIREVKTGNHNMHQDVPLEAITIQATSVVE